MRLAGYAARTKLSEGVLRDIHVKALAIEERGGAKLLILTADLLLIRADLAEDVARKCREEFGIPRERILLNASHTHSAPVYGAPEPDEAPRPGYDFSSPERSQASRYGRELRAKFMEAARAAMKDLRPASLAFEQGFAGFAVNRRRVWKRELPGPVDHDVPVLRVLDGNGKPVAIVAGYACHATVLGDYRINGDWPGFAQEEIEKQHPGAVALFMQGCGADANPLPRRSVELAQLYGHIFAASVAEVVRGRMRPLASPVEAAFDAVELPFEDLPPRATFEQWMKSGTERQKRQARHNLSVLDKGGTLPSSYRYPLQTWRFGGELTLIAMGGEVVVDYALRLKQRHGHASTWVAAYSNDYGGYIGSARVIREGGYEGGEANSGFPAFFKTEIEDRIVDRIDSMLGKK